jgi:hypothetical protein
MLSYNPEYNNPSGRILHVLKMKLHSAWSNSSFASSMLFAFM